jgi:hypothetical protein
MPNLYFCQPHAKNQGMLRAVLSMNECEQVVSQKSMTYFGDKFPGLADGPAGEADFAVLRFGQGETDGSWQPGYYRLDSNLTELNDLLRELAR